MLQPKIKNNVKERILSDIINQIDRLKMRYSQTSNKHYQLYKARLNIRKEVSLKNQIVVLIELIALLLVDTEKNNHLLFKLCLLRIESKQSDLIKQSKINAYRDDMVLIARSIAYYYLADSIINTEYKDSDHSNNQRFEFAQISLSLQSQAAEKLESDLYG